VIRVSLDDATVATGEMLTGRVHWTAEDERGARAIAIVAQWHTLGEGDRAYGVGRGTRVVIQRDQRNAEIPFRLLIPHEGPITFEGELVSIVWRLWVRVDRLGLDEIAETEFRVGARRRT